MKGLTAADIHARTEATMWTDGCLRISSKTFTNMRGRKQIRKSKKIVSIILVNLRSSIVWDLTLITGLVLFLSTALGLDLQ